MVVGITSHFKNLFFFLKSCNVKDLCIALSGGADSTALVFLTKFFIEEYLLDIKIHAITIDHMLRENSTEEALFLGQIMNFWKINHTIIKWENFGVSSNVQAEARNNRYKIISKWCIENGIFIALTAHNIEDQSETVMMRLFRGSGVSGLRAISDSIKINNVSFFRPLLYNSKQELYDYLFEIGVPFFEDPSNFSDKYDRSKFRVLCSNIRKNFPKMDHRLAVVAKNMHSTEVILERYKNRIKEECVFYESNGDIIISLVLLQEPIDLIVMVMVDILSCFIKSRRCIKMANIKKIIQQIFDGENISIKISDHRIVTNESCIKILKSSNDR